MLELLTVFTAFVYRTACSPGKGGRKWVNTALFTLILPLLAFSFEIVSALSDDTVNFQGKIVIKSDGTNVTETSPSCVESGADTCDFRIGYYNASTGGTLLWQEDFVNQEIGEYEGIFNLVLGTGSNNSGSESSFEDVFINNNDVYMAISLDTDGNGDFASPEVFTRDGTNRMQIRSVPYATHSKTADNITDSNTQFIRNQVIQQSGASFNIDGSGTIAGNFTVDTDTLFIDATNHRVGVGTVTPNYKLTIQGTLAVLEGGVTPTHYTVFQGADQSATITYTLPATSGTDGQVLAIDASNNLYWTTISGGTPGGNDGYIQFNNSGSFGGSANLFWDETNSYLGIGTTNPGASIDIMPASASALKINPFGPNAGDTGEIRFLELAANGAHYSGFKAPDSLTVNNIYTMPASYPSVSAFLKSDTAGSLSWDISTYLTSINWSQVLNGAGIYMDYQPNNTPCTNNQVIKYNSVNGRWECANDIGTPAGSTGEIQFNNAGAFGASSSLYWDITNSRLGIGTIVPSDKLNIAQSISSASANGAGISYTQTTNVANLTGSALDISVTSSGDAGDTIYAININNITATSSTEYGVNIGTGWERDFNFNNTAPVWGFVNNAEMTWTDGTNNLLQAKDLNTNFGMALNTGAFIDRNSYIGEEFTAFKTTRTNDYAGNQAASFGDNGGWGIYSTGAGHVSVSSQNIANGILRMQVTGGTNRGSAAFMDRGANTLHTILNAGNLPVFLIKVRPSLAGTFNVLFTGMANQTDAANTDPTEFLGFTNNGTTTWTGRTTTGGASTNVTCTGQTISTTNFALMMIEVRSATDVRFYIDADVSNGIDFFYCGQSTSNIPAASYPPELIYQIRTGGTTGHYLDVDFIRVWQDDSKQQVAEDPAVDAGSYLTDNDYFINTTGNTDNYNYIPATDNGINGYIFTGTARFENQVDITSGLTINGSTRINSDLFVNDNIQSTGLDISCFKADPDNKCGLGIAEIYSSSEPVWPGDIVAIGPDGKIAKTKNLYQNNSIGVVVKQPAILFDSEKISMGSNLNYNHNGYYPAVVTNGRNYIKVSSVNGQVLKGDYLTASSIPGVAMKMGKPGYAIAIALENTADNGVSIISALIKPGYIDPNDTINSISDELNVLSGKVQTIKDDTATIQATNDEKLNNLSKSVDLNKSEIEKFTLSIEDLFKKISELEQKIKNIEGNINSEIISGSATINKGETEVEVKFDSVLSNDPIINLTSKTPVNKGSFYLNSESKSGFKIKLTEPLEEDAVFNYLIILQ